MNFTLPGGNGFIGRCLQQQLQAAGHEVFLPERDFQIDPQRNYGHVIFCVGLTADFRVKPRETVDAHVCLLNRYLYGMQFESFLYLSSTRVYRFADNTSESADVPVNSNDPDQIYNLSKLMGESACLTFDHPAVRVARLSNVFGEGAEDSFLGQLIQQSRQHNRLMFETAADSEKDYISIEAVCNLLEQISLKGKHRLYNLADGSNINNQQIGEWIGDALGIEVEFKSEAPSIRFPKIDNHRIQQEFSYLPGSAQVDLRTFINNDPEHHNELV
jgi:nucleoside-diphosphate-sugar epimerase